jgi:hypothetical protein
LHGSPSDIEFDLGFTALKGASSIDGNLRDGQSVFRWVVEVQDFLNWEHHVGTERGKPVNAREDWANYIPTLYTDWKAAFASGGLEAGKKFYQDHAGKTYKGSPGTSDDSRNQGAFHFYSIGRVPASLHPNFINTWQADFLGRFEVEEKE